MDFNESLNISNTAFGFAIGIQMLMWGLTGPIFGAIADRYGGHKAIISAFLFYTLGIYFLYSLVLVILKSLTLLGIWLKVIVFLKVGLTLMENSSLLPPYFPIF